MSEQIVTEARRLLNNAEDVNVHYSDGPCSCGTCAFDAAAHNLVRGLLAEVDRLRDGGSMASATRKDAAPAAEPAVLHASIDPPAAEWSETYPISSLDMETEPAVEPRCLCTHRWAEHYGPCQRPGCGCRIFEETCQP